MNIVVSMKDLIPSVKKYMLLPDKLKAQKFCMWKYKDRDGKPTKVPYQADPARFAYRLRAESDNPETFTSFDTALSLWKKNHKYYDGLGIGVFGDLVAIDIDDCIDENGNLSEMAADIVNTVQSYTEVSPSGHGIRIFGFAEKGFTYSTDEYYINNRKTHLEIYVAGMTSKFLTVTGNRINDRDPCYIDSKLGKIIERYMKREKKRSSQGIRDVPAELKDIPDNELLDIARNAVNGDKFSQLWNGHISGYTSQSEADIALCSLLAFYTGCDTDRIDRLFRMSGLYRDKWDAKRAGSTYGADTIKNAVSQCTEVYTPKNQKAPEGFEPFDPYDKDVLDTLPDFPVECLPDTLKAFVCDIADAIEAPRGMVACEVFSVLAACCMGKVRIKLTPSWTEHVNLYIFGIGLPGDLKSATLLRCITPLYDWIAERNKQLLPKTKHDAAEVIILKKRYERLEKSLSNPPKRKSRKGRVPFTDDDSEYTEAIEFPHNVSASDLADLQLQIEEAEGNAEKLLTFLVDDTTPEALGTVMAENNGKAVIISAEGGFSDIVAGRYSGSANLDLVNKSYSGEPYTYTRRTSGTINLERPLATIGLFIQPDVVRSAISNDHMRGRGYVSRFLMCYPKPLVGSRQMIDRAEDPQITEKYKDLCFSLLNMEDHSSDICLSPEASDLFRDFRLYVDKGLAKFGELEPVRDVASRIPGSTGRIMALLHLAQYADRASLVPVSADEARNAVCIGKYFLEHTKGIFQSFGGTEDEADESARRILDKLQKNPAMQQFKPEDLRKVCRSFRSVKEMAVPLQRLKERGYLSIQTVKNNRARPSVLIQLNPEAFPDRFQVTAEEVGR